MMNIPVLLLAAAAGTMSLSFEKPLATGTLKFCDAMRYLDVKLDRPMDLSAAKGVSFELKCEDPSIIENVWFLFKSGNGYYRAAAEKPAELAREVEMIRANGLRDIAFFRLQEYAPQCLDALFEKR